MHADCFNGLCTGHLRKSRFCEREHVGINRQFSVRARWQKKTEDAAAGTGLTLRVRTKMSSGSIFSFCTPEGAK